MAGDFDRFDTDGGGAGGEWQALAPLAPASAASEPEHPRPPVTPPVAPVRAVTHEPEHPKPPVTTPAPPVGSGDHPPTATPPLTGGQTLTGTMGADELKGGLGADSLAGGDGGDFLRGEGGRDTLSGGGGADTLSGGAGADLLTGGPGGDTFQIIGPVSNGPGDLDRITDFTHGEDHLAFGGHMKLTDGTFATGVASSYADALKFATARIVGGAADVVAMQVGADVVVFADSGHHNHVDAAVVLVGKTLAALGAGDIF